MKNSTLAKILSLVMLVAMLAGGLVSAYAATTPPAPEGTTLHNTAYDSYRYLAIDFTSSDSGYLNSISAVSVDGNSYSNGDGKYMLSYGNYYTIDKSSYSGYTVNLPVGTSLPAEVTITATGYDDLTFTIDADGNISTGGASEPVDVTYPSGTKTIVTGETFTGNVIVESGAEVTFANCTFQKGIKCEDSTALAILQNATFIEPKSGYGMTLAGNYLGGTYANYTLTKDDGVFVGLPQKTATQKYASNSATLSSASISTKSSWVNAQAYNPSGYSGYYITGTTPKQDRYEVIAMSATYSGSYGTFSTEVPFVISLNKLSVEFEENGGSSVEDQEVFYNEKAEEPENPTKSGYTFAGWYADESLTTPFSFDAAITEDTIVYAKWSNTYTVTWKSADGSETLKKDEDVEAGVTPSFDGTEPTKAADDDYTYEFIGWAASANAEEALETLPNVTGDATYYAVFKATPIPKYTVTYTDGVEGEEIFADQTAENLKSGDATPAFSGEPAREGYDFTGWAPEVAATVTGDATYTAQWRIKTFTVTWKNGDSELEKDEAVEYGSKPGYEGSEPAKAATAQYSYAFVGWSADANATSGAAVDALPEVTEDATYYAIFAESENTCTVAFDSDGGSEVDSQNVTYNAKASEPEAPAKEGYVFKGWRLDGEDYDFDTLVTGDITLKALWAPVYTITWLNDDGSALGASTVEEGETPAYDGTPAKAATDQRSYTFKGWTPAVVPATENATYTATYSSSLRSYTVTWKNGDDTLAEDSVEYGAMPAYSGSAPTKEGTDEIDYVFAGWNEDVVPVTEDAVYTAKFTAVPKKLAITKTLSVEGAAISGTDTATFTFNIASEDEDAPAIDPVTITMDVTDGASGAGSIALPSVDAALTGDFAYTISEAQSGFPTGGEGEYDDSTYTLTMRVVDGVITQVTVAANGGEGKDDAIEFENSFKYDEIVVDTTELTVSKAVVGGSAGAFDFQIKFSASSQLGAENVLPVVKDTETTIAYGDAGHSFQLSDGDSITFVVPVGTTYSVQESGTANYQPSARVISGGQTDSNLTAAKGESLNVADKVAAEGSNSVAFTNTYVKPDAPLMGVVEKNAPFLILAVVAVLAFALYIVDRRRKANRK